MGGFNLARDPQLPPQFGTERDQAVSPRPSPSLARGLTAMQRRRAALLDRTWSAQRPHSGPQRSAYRAGASGRVRDMTYVRPSRNLRLASGMLAVPPAARLHTRRTWPTTPVHRSDHGLYIQPRSQIRASNSPSRHVCTLQIHHLRHASGKNGLLKRRGAASNRGADRFAARETRGARSDGGASSHRQTQVVTTCSSRCHPAASGGTPASTGTS